MRLRTWFATALALLATCGACGLPGSLSTASASDAAAAQPAGDTATPADGVRALEGEWIFVEDRTEGRTLEQFSPPMSSKFSFRVDEGEDAFILNGHGSGHRDVRVALDGTVTEVVDQNTITRYRGAWKDGGFAYQAEFVRVADGQVRGLYRKEFRVTDEGLLVRVNTGPGEDTWSVGLYRQQKDIPPPVPAPAVIGDLDWLGGAWLGTRMSGSSIEERWSPPGGGGMLAISRTVNTSGRMSAFEYLRIMERDGGLVYIAQPGGRAATEFTMTALTTEGGVTRAVFDNPYHDFPNRIMYELSADGKMTTSVGQLVGGSPIRIEFTREEN